MTFERFRFFKLPYEVASYLVGTFLDWPTLVAFMDASPVALALVLSNVQLAVDHAHHMHARYIPMFMERLVSSGCFVQAVNMHSRIKRKFKVHANYYLVGQPWLADALESDKLDCEPGTTWVLDLNPSVLKIQNQVPQQQQQQQARPNHYCHVTISEVVAYYAQMAVRYLDTDMFTSIVRRWVENVPIANQTSGHTDDRSFRKIWQCIIDNNSIVSARAMFTIGCAYVPQDIVVWDRDMSLLMCSQHRITKHRIGLMWALRYEVLDILNGNIIGHNYVSDAFYENGITFESPFNMEEAMFRFAAKIGDKQFILRLVDKFNYVPFTRYSLHVKELFDWDHYDSSHPALFLKYAPLSTENDLLIEAYNLISVPGHYLSVVWNAVISDCVLEDARYDLSALCGVMIKIINNYPNADELLTIIERYPESFHRMMVHPMYCDKLLCKLIAFFKDSIANRRKLQRQIITALTPDFGSTTSCPSVPRQAWFCKPVFVLFLEAGWRMEQADWSRFFVSDVTLSTKKAMLAYATEKNLLHQ